MHANYAICAAKVPPRITDMRKGKRALCLFVARGVRAKEYVSLGSDSGDGSNGNSRAKNQDACYNLEFGHPDACAIALVCTSAPEG